jgi:hypothetical protein
MAPLRSVALSPRESPESEAIAALQQSIKILAIEYKRAALLQQRRKE